MQWEEQEQRQWIDLETIEILGNFIKSALDKSGILNYNFRNLAEGMAQRQQIDV